MTAVSSTARPSGPREHQTGAMAAAPHRNVANIGLIAAGAACIALTVGAVVVRQFGLLPENLAAIIALLAAGIGLRVLLAVTARSATPLARRRISVIVSTVGLAVSATVLIFALPVATRTGGAQPFVNDLSSIGLTLALLTVVASPVRTLSWRAFVGTGLTGYLGVSVLARMIGRPIIEAAGAHSILGPVIWNPIDEEVVRSLPLVLIVALAARAKAARPSAIDIALLGAWCGGGYALYEDTQYGRGFSPQFGSNPPFSLLFPTEERIHAAGGLAYAQDGHLVWSTLIGLALAIAVLYRTRFPRIARLAPLVIIEVIVEHAVTDYLDISAGPNGTPPLVSLLSVLTLNGYLSNILLFSGGGFVLWCERKAIGPVAAMKFGLVLRPSVAATRARQLAAFQRRPADRSDRGAS